MAKSKNAIRFTFYEHKYNNITKGNQLSVVIKKGIDIDSDSYDFTKLSKGSGTIVMIDKDNKTVPGTSVKVEYKVTQFFPDNYCIIRLERNPKFVR